jgi:hypothetical protein
MESIQRQNQNDPMTRNQIIAMQSRIGTTLDGFWGPKSIAACQRHLRSLMPVHHPWPNPDAASLRAFYGEPGTEGNLEPLNVAGLGIEYEGSPVRIVRCHEDVAESLLRVLKAIAAGPHAAVLAEYAGCYNFRRKRGGSSYSLHAYGAAIDLDPDNNGFRDSWPMRSTMPLAVMEEFAKEGWKSAGAFWGYDAMHFEATR